MLAHRAEVRRQKTGVRIINREKQNIECRMFKGFKLHNSKFPDPLLNILRFKILAPGFWLKVKKYYFTRILDPWTPRTL
jgi:hypothetical protein